VTADDADRAADAGAAFLVTPGFGPGVPRGAELGLPVLAGGFTATEAITAMANGATAVKLFPAATGGPGYLRALRDPLPHVPFVPVGGVDVGEVAPYLQAGAVAVGVGSPLLRDAARGGDLDELRERALRFLAAVGAAP
jgi:2-dehydro-3-deoxyphosphogluconate aldolase/(4S)-4-hydroxy-2-oxoglutarate aldolase